MREEVAIAGLIAIAVLSIFYLADPRELVLAISTGLLGYLRGRSETKGPYDSIGRRKRTNLGEDGDTNQKQ